MRQFAYTLDVGALSFLRFVRRIPGVSRQPELPSLERLLEAEAGQPHNIYRVLARVIPPTVLAFGAASVGLAWWSNSGTLPMAIGSVVTVLITGGSWILFDRLDKSIPRSKKRLRKLAAKLLERYGGFSNIAGFDPALSVGVGKVLDEAAEIYLKHCSASSRGGQALFEESRSKATRALEEAMARLLELSEPKDVHSQDQELATGWADTMLHEMRELDRVLDDHARNAIIEQETAENEPLAALREARHELGTIDTAIEELDRNRSN